LENNIILAWLKFNVRTNIVGILFNYGPVNPFIKENSIS